MQNFIRPGRLFCGALVPDWLLGRTEVSKGAKLCWGYLARMAGDKDHCSPGQDFLAKDLGVSVRQIQRYISELEKYSLLYVVQVGETEPNKYYFPEHEWMEFRNSENGPPPGSRSARRNDATSTSHKYNQVEYNQTNMSGGVSFVSHSKGTIDSLNPDRGQAPATPIRSGHSVAEEAVDADAAEYLAAFKKAWKVIYSAYMDEKPVFDELSDKRLINLYKKKDPSINTLLYTALKAWEATTANPKPKEKGFDPYRASRSAVHLHEFLKLNRYERIRRELGIAGSASPQDLLALLKSFFEDEVIKELRD